MKHFYIIMLVLVFSSCAHYKDIPYFQNSAEYDGSQGQGIYDLTIRPKDKLTIVVFSGADKEAVAEFNLRDPRPAEYERGRIRVSASQIEFFIITSLITKGILTFQF